MPGTREEPCSGRWFVKYFGFSEGPYDWTRSRFNFEDGYLSWKDDANKAQSAYVGPFEVVLLEQLAARLAELGRVQAGYPSCELQYNSGEDTSGGLTFRNIVASTEELHAIPENNGAVFQVCSLFNCLNSSDPSQTPEDGVEGYFKDNVQGSTRAIACPAATVFRNYFVNGNGQAGKNGRQLNCLAEVSEHVRNKQEGYWSMRNGYCMPKPPVTKFTELSSRIRKDPVLVEGIESRLQVGVHWDTTVSGSDNRVCQVFCSTAPVGLTKLLAASAWEPFARVLLSAGYKATLAAAALLASQRRERVRVYLTVIGGGALGNRLNWIVWAIRKALNAFREALLDVVLVHYSEVGHFKSVEEGFKAPILEHHHFRRSVTEEVASIRAVYEAIDREVELEYMGMPGHMSPTQAVALAFTYFDANGDGCIDRGEFTNVLRSIDPVLFTLKNVDRLMAEADADGDGVIYYAEFIAWIFGEDQLIVSRVLGTAKLGGANRFEGDTKLRVEVLPEAEPKNKAKIRYTHGFEREGMSCPPHAFG